MAAHALTIARELVARIHGIRYKQEPEATEQRNKLCDEIVHACGYAPGMDLLTMDTFHALDHAAAAHDFEEVQHVLESRVLPESQYMRFYGCSEDVKKAQMTFAGPENSPQHMERWRKFVTEDAPHRELAAGTFVLDLKPTGPKLCV